MVDHYLYEINMAVAKIMLEPETKITCYRIQALMQLEFYCKAVSKNIGASEVLGGLLDTVCGKKIEFIMSATTKGALEDIVKPHAVDLRSGIPSSLYYIEEEELLGMVLLLPSHIIPNQAAERRLFYLINKLLPDLSEQLLDVLRDQNGDAFADRYRAMMADPIIE